MQPNSNPQGQYGVPPAPPVPPAPTPKAQPVDSALRVVIVLMFVNLGLSVVTTIVTLVLRSSVLDYELLHSNLPADATPIMVDVTRKSLEAALWGKLAGSVLISVLYIWRAYALRRGSRGAYLRLYYICVIGLLGIAYLILAGHYPIWMRIEQGLQAIVLVALLISVSRKEVRNRFAKQQPVLG